MNDNLEFQEWKKRREESFPDFQVWKKEMEEMIARGEMKQPSPGLRDGGLALFYVISRKAFEEKTREVNLGITEIIFLMEKYCGTNELVELFKEEQDMENFFDFIESVSE